MWIVAVIGLGTILAGPIGFAIGVGIVIWVLVEKDKVPEEQFEYSQQEQQNSNNTKDFKEFEIEQQTPCIDLLCHYALKYEPEWRSEKVKYIKNLFNNICQTQSDSEFLKNRLKLTPRPNIESCIRDWLNTNPNTEDKQIIFNAVSILLVNTCTDLNKIKVDSLTFGSKIGLSDNYCKDFLSELMNDTNQNANKEVEEAADFLGVSSDASVEEIQRAYRLKIKDYHPDRNINVTPAVKKMLEQQAHLINAARDILLASK